MKRFLCFGSECAVNYNAPPFSLSSAPHVIGVFVEVFTDIIRIQNTTHNARQRWTTAREQDRRNQDKSHVYWRRKLWTAAIGSCQSLKFEWMYANNAFIYCFWMHVFGKWICSSPYTQATLKREQVCVRTCMRLNTSYVSLNTHWFSWSNITRRHFTSKFTAQTHTHMHTGYKRCDFTFRSQMQSRFILQQQLQQQLQFHLNSEFLKIFSWKLLMSTRFHS